MNHLPEVIVVLAITGFAGISVLTLARALAQRIGRGGGADRREIDALRDDVEILRTEHESMRERLGQMDELQNRLDFAERMLAQGKDKQALPGAR